MVCLVATSNAINNSETHGKSHNTDAMADGNEDDKLKLRRLAGGNIVEYPPLFSPDGDVLFIIFKNLVQVYSATTGEWLRDLEGCAENVIGLQYELGNTKILAALTRTGEMVRWKWKSGSVECKRKLPLENCEVLSFHFVELLPDSTSAFVTFRRFVRQNAEWAVFNMTTGNRVDISGNMELKSGRTQIEVENEHFHYVAAIQNFFLTIQNYKNGRTRRWSNANKVPFTIVRVHPSEEMVATGDEMGRVFLWHNIYGAKHPQTTLYHWHHTPVTSIAFTKTGTGFYSSGQESVLVQWNISRPDLKNFVPRMHAMIIHVAVGEDNRKVAVCTADNGVQILNSQNNAKCMLQGFTYIYNDKTGLNKFPIGLKLNPKNNSLALNGRIGHIQFYSTYTRRLLYNMNIVMQNQLSMETGKILYNIRVVAAAFNVEWMATIEEWNDHEHSPEIRLKFWNFNKESQNYVLNTNIEGSHEEGVKAIEFSSATETENLLCATAGYDDYIKVWSLEDSDNIYRTGKVWYCIARANYKKFNLECINFSHDGSLLAAGFRNTLCIYKSQTLALKATLSAPGRFNGTIKKIDIQLPEGKIQTPRKELTNKNELVEKRRRVLELFRSLLDGSDEKLIQQLAKQNYTPKKNTSFTPNPVPRADLTTEHQENLFNKILSLTDLSLFQKIDLYQKLDIYCSVPKEYRNNIAKYIAKNIIEKDSIECNIDRTIKNINRRHRFKAKYWMYKFRNRKIKSDDDESLASVMTLLGLSDQPSKFQNNHNAKSKLESSRKCNGYVDNDEEMKSENNASEKCCSPLETVANIKHVSFATGEYAHLIVACTENRVLIWDILSLRLRSVLRLSVARLIVDPLTSLFAAFTINDELYVFPPNAPMPLYHRVNVPKIQDAIWVPRRYPKSYSLSLDWQAISTLYFLTKDQELVYLADDKEDDISVTTFVNEAQDTVKYSTFGTFAAKQANAKQVRSTQNNSSIGVQGKAAVKSLTEMTTHTMAPIHLLCADFIESMTKTEADHKDIPASNDDAKDAEKMDVSDSEEESDVNIKRKLKQAVLDQYSEVRGDSGDKSKQIKQREKTKKLLKEGINIIF